MRRVQGSHVTDTPPDKLPAGIEHVVMGNLFGDAYADPYRKDPVGWIRDVLGEEVWSLQAELAIAIAFNTHVAAKACHGVGKSWLAARIIAWWVCTHPPEETLVLFTAPTFAQVWGIIGKELGILFAKARARGNPLPGRLLNRGTEWFIGDTLVAQGLKPEDNNENAFQGRHARYTLGIGDEADGLPASIWTGLDAIATTEDARTFVVGNPMDPSGEFATVCGDNPNTDAENREEKVWDKVITIGAFDTPNFTDEHVSDKLRKVLVSRDWVDKRRKRWGEGSAPWEGRVMGRFPKSANDKLISPEWIKKAKERTLKPHGHARLAMDVARSGDNETVIYEWWAGRLRFVEGEFDSTAPTVKRMARDAIHARRSQAAMNIDADGIGGPIYDDLHEEEEPVYEFRGGRAADDPTRFVNARSEAYWQLRLLFQDGAIDLDPDDDVLAAQLSNIKWSLDRSGRVRVETKDEMRARGVPSPDRADAVMMASVYLGSAEYEIEQLTQSIELERLKSGLDVTPIGGLTAGLLDEGM